MDKKNIFPMFYDEPLTDLNFSNWKLLPPMFRCFIGITRFERKIGFFLRWSNHCSYNWVLNFILHSFSEIWVKKMSLQVPPGGLGASQIQQIRRCSTSCSPEILTWTGVLVCVSRMLATRSRPRASVSFDPADHRPYEVPRLNPPPPKESRDALLNDFPLFMMTPSSQWKLCRLIESTLNVTLILHPSDPFRNGKGH